MSAITKDFTVSGGPRIDVKKVDQAKLGYPNSDMNKDNGGLVKATGSKSPNVDSKKDPVKATMDNIANPPCPREQMRGQRNSRNYNENGKAFRGSEFASQEAK
jgi:hypothetical protein